MDDNQLYHFGIKGMKWGVRRTPEQLGQKKMTRREKRAARIDLANNSLTKGDQAKLTAYAIQRGNRAVDKVLNRYGKNPLKKNALEKAMRKTDRSIAYKKRAVKALGRVGVVAIAGLGAAALLKVRV